MRTRVAAIVQARMGSVRLPGKVLLPLLGQPVLAHVIHRVQQVPEVDDVIVAVPQKDLQLAQLARSCGAKVYAGHEFDVLERYFWAARWYSVDVVMRVTADCPLWSPDVGSAVLGAFLDGGYDYASNVHDDHMGGTTDGLDVEVFTRQALASAWIHATTVTDREHVTGYIRARPRTALRPDGFRLARWPVGEHRGRWSLDTPEDLARVEAVYRELGTDFTWREVMALQERWGARTS